MLGGMSAFLERDMTFGSIMKILELQSFVHAFTTIIAVILITNGKGKAKNIADNTKANKTIFWYFTVALILIVLATPWGKLF